MWHSGFTTKQRYGTAVHYSNTMVHQSGTIEGMDAGSTRWECGAGRHGMASFWLGLYAGVRASEFSIMSVYIMMSVGGWWRFSTVLGDHSPVMMETTVHVSVAKHWPV